MESRIELRHLVAFLAIAQELHFGRAAARLHLATASLSEQLQRLERAVGVELVRRTPHDVRLTSAGRAFEPEARRILDQAERAVQVARQAASGRSGTVSVGFNFPAGQLVLEPTLRRLGADYPDVSTRLWEARSGPQLAALAEGKIDVALAFAGSLAARLPSRRLLTLPLVAVVGDRHPWAGRRSVAFGELAQQRCLLFRRDESPAMHDAIFAAADHSGIRLTIDAEVDDPGATGLVATTRDVVAFASTIRGLEAPMRDLVSVRLVDPTPTIGVYAVWRADPQPAVRAFLRSLAAAGPFTDGAEADEAVETAASETATPETAASEAATPETAASETAARPAT